MQHIKVYSLEVGESNLGKLGKTLNDLNTQ